MLFDIAWLVLCSRIFVFFLLASERLISFTTVVKSHHRVRFNTSPFFLTNKIDWRCLTWVLDATSLSLSLSVDLERKLLVCLDALSSLVQYQFVDTLRDACAITDEIFANNDSYRSTFGSFLDSFAKLPRMLFETTIEAQTTKSRDENMKKVVYVKIYRA